MDATPRDPVDASDVDEEIPEEDLPVPEMQPETQGHDPVIADLGPDGEGDVTADGV